MIDQMNTVSKTRTNEVGYIQKKIQDIEFEIAHLQKRKIAKDYLKQLKLKLTILNQELIEASDQAKKKRKKFKIKKSGAAKVGVVGFPSVGKSSLMEKLTSVNTEENSFKLTKMNCVPGVAKYNGARIQLLGLPGIIEDNQNYQGKDKQTMAIARTCDLILIVLDATRTMTYKKIIESRLEKFGIRLNKEPPKINIIRKEKGGINLVEHTRLTKLHREAIFELLREYRIVNADIIFNCDPDMDDIIDVIQGNKRYIPCIYALNKIDAISIEELKLLTQIPHSVPVSVKLEQNFEELFMKIWDYLDLIRIYPKPKGKDPDFMHPFIMKRNKSTVEDIVKKIHKELLNQFKYAFVWGKSVIQYPQKVGINHQLMDEDVVQIVKKNK